MLVYPNSNEKDHGGGRDKDLLANMKAFIRKQGYEVAVTTSCREGLQILGSFNPDLIFLDIDVGEEDGRKMCRDIMSQAEYRHIPVILISANHEALKLYQDYGAATFIHKPFLLSGIINTMGQYLTGT